MKLAILGATGFVGTVLLPKTIAQGHQIKVLVRSPEKQGSVKDKVEVVTGDMFDTAAVETLVQAVDAVISVAGPPMKGKFDVERYANVTKHLVAAMKMANVQRIITITGAAAKVPGQKLGIKQSLLHLVLGTFVRPDVIKVNDLELEMIAESGLNWTVLRPPLIGSGKATGHVATSETDMPGMKIDVGAKRTMIDNFLSMLWMVDSGWCITIHYPPSTLFPKYPLGKCLVSNKRCIVDEVFTYREDFVTRMKKNS